MPLTKQVSAKIAILIGVVTGFIPAVFILGIAFIYLFVDQFIHSRFFSFPKIGLVLVTAMVVMVIVSGILRRVWLVWAFDNTHEPSALKRLAIQFGFLHHDDTYYADKYRNSVSAYGKTMRRVAAINEQVADADDPSVPAEWVMRAPGTGHLNVIAFLLVLMGLFMGFFAAFIYRDKLDKVAFGMIALAVVGFAALAYWAIFRKRELPSVHTIRFNAAGIGLNEEWIGWEQVSGCRVVNNRRRMRFSRYGDALRLLMIRFEDGSTRYIHLSGFPGGRREFEHYMAVFRWRYLAEKTAMHPSIQN